MKNFPENFENDYLVVEEGCPYMENLHKLSHVTWLNSYFVFILVLLSVLIKMLSEKKWETNSKKQKKQGMFARTISNKISSIGVW